MSATPVTPLLPPASISVRPALPEIDRGLRPLADLGPRCSQAVILAGHAGGVLFPAGTFYPKLGLPIANAPLLQHLAVDLAGLGVREITVVAARHQRAHRALVRRLRRDTPPGLELRFLGEDVPRGTAGALKAAARRAGRAPLLVVPPNVLLGGFDLAAAWAAHRSTRAALTVVVEAGDPHGDYLENTLLDEAGCVREIVVLHRSCDRRQGRAGGPGAERRRPLLPTCIYIVEPEVLRLIPEHGYLDLKEQLVPLLRRRGLDVRAWLHPGRLQRIDTLADYFAVSRSALGDPQAGRRWVPPHYREIGERIWAGRGVRVAPGVTLRGPLLLGDHCRVEAGARLVGPLTLGARAHVGAGAHLEDATLGRGVVVGAGARVERSLVAQRFEIAARARLRDVVAARARLGGVSRALLAGSWGATLAISDGRPLHRLRRQVYMAVKRAFDVAVAAGLLLLTAPLALLIALAVKLDSRGPVLFAQRRCGKHGREFPMLKFRTMVPNALEIHADLVARKDVDGPMFKLENDPRVTRVGRFLRGTSLDELPQLLNVLAGHMSLVGPRPLIMREMSFAPAWRDLRLSVRPGITGLWQVEGRSRVSFHEWIRNDIRYVYEQSLWLDCGILWRTLRALRGGERR